MSRFLLTVRRFVSHGLERLVLHGRRALPQGLGHDVHRELVGGHHDGRVGDLSDQLGDKAAVKAGPAFFAGNDSQRLPK